MDNNTQSQDSNLQYKTCCLICGEEINSETRQLCGKWRCYAEDNTDNIIND